MTRFRHSDGSIVHLAYCTNVHPAEDLDGVMTQLRKFSGGVRETLGWSTLGVGLWLPAPLAKLLAKDEGRLKLLIDCLNENGLEVVTLNGFPYQAFQAEVVKLEVFKPDWTKKERLEYTIDLATVLHKLLPSDAASGSISTLPLGWRTRDMALAPAKLLILAKRLDELADEFGRPVRLAIEPEPGCSVETADRAIDVIAELDTEWIGMCLDTCHLAVQFEDIDATLAKAREARVPIVKSQLSSALRVPDPADIEWLSEFNEPRFLHQARQIQDGRVASVDDLRPSTREILSGDSEWRIHYHVPVDHDDGRTTQPELKTAIRSLVGGDVAQTTHLEVETYTWSVLPENRRPKNDADLIAGLASEMNWTASQLEEAGLERIV